MSKKKVAKRKVPRKGKQKTDSLSPQSANTTDDIFEDSEKLYQVTNFKFKLNDIQPAHLIIV